ncbi:MAG: hypothetical protein IKB99_09685 [Lentisphaeria bacterium]|nr:hypothetical protein [Lentisphaeria bacterium]
MANKTINRVGLSRAGFSAEAINNIKNLYKIYYRSGLNATQALEKIKQELPQAPEVVEFLDFCANTQKGIIAPNREGRRS